MIEAHPDMNNLSPSRASSHSKNVALEININSADADQQSSPCLEHGFVS